jgi:hypothetical protein
MSGIVGTFKSSVAEDRFWAQSFLNRVIIEKRKDEPHLTDRQIAEKYFTPNTLLFWESCMEKTN